MKFVAEGYEGASVSKTLDMKKIFFLLIIFFSIGSPSKSQDWIRIFGNNMIADVTWVIETYDKGYLILDNSHDYLWLIKTDINGVKLWDKHIGTGHDDIRFDNIEQTSDGGYILAGDFAKYATGIYDPCIIKLDPCGELQWCSDIHLPATDDFATRVKQTPQGNYILLTMYSGPYIISLYKLDGTGNPVWKQDYHPDSLIFDEADHDVRVDEDGYLISADCYYSEYPGGGGYERPYFIKTDTSGNLNWWLVYGLGNGYYGYTWDQTIKSSSGNYYAYGWHSNYVDSPGLVKITSSGQESYYQEILPGPGGLATATFLNDTTLIIQAGGHINGVYTQRWINADTMGVARYFVEHLETWMTNTYHTIKTFDNKFVNVSQGNDIWIYLYKFNSNLEYDSIYTRQFIYDSLCPGGVISDTINPDCDLIVGIDEVNPESESGQLKISPNPASDILKVEFPKYIKRREMKKGITTTASYYQWKNTTLSVYDLFGIKILQKEIPKSMTELLINVSNWSRRMYLFNLSWNNEVISNKKVIIQ